MKKERLCPHCMKEMPEGEQKICPHCGYDFDNPREITHQLKPFTILEGKYLVGDVLGEGGFGITYIGFDLNLEIRVAIKEFYPNGFATRESQHTSELTAYAGQNMEAVYKWRDSFVKEARSLAKCSHLPGIVGVKDYFQENNTAYIIMEYLEGQTLKEYMKANGGKLPADRVLQVMRPVISSLEEVHKEGLIHRDISPDNLILLKGGNVKLLDFGAARDYTESGERSLSVMLKPGYAPEEQYRTKGKQGPWSDVYALCATIYKCITGVTPPESMERMRQDELTKISSLGIPISPQVETALEKGMAVFAEERCQSMGELENLLYESGNAVPAEAVPNVSQPAPSVTPAEEKVVTETVAAAVQTEEQKEVLQEKKEEQNAGFINKPIEWIKKNKKAVLAVAGIAVLLFAVVKFNGKKDAEDTAQVAANTAENQEQAVSVGAVPQVEENLPVQEEEQEQAEETVPENNVVEHAYKYVVADCTWTEAYTACQTAGGHLVTFDSPEEYEDVLSAIEEQDLQDCLFYIGGMRDVNSYDYYWIEEGGDSQTVLNQAYADYWLEGEPSYADGEIVENCMMIFFYSDEEEESDEWVWNDVPDNVLAVGPYYAGRIGYICEYENAADVSLDEKVPESEPQVDMAEKAREIEAWENQRSSLPNIETVEFGESFAGMPLYEGEIYNGMLVYAYLPGSAGGRDYTYMDNRLCSTSISGPNGRYTTYFYNGEVIKVVYDSFDEEESASYVHEYGKLTDEDRQWDSQEGEKIRRIFSSDEYILPDADSRYIGREELEGAYSGEELRYIRNEFYARHGYIFQDDTLREYFMGKSWYSPEVTEVPESMLNEYEIANRDLVIELEQ